VCNRKSRVGRFPGLGLAEPFCHERGDFLRLLVGGKVACIGEQMELASTRRGREGLHFGGGDGGVFCSGDGEDGRIDCWDGSPRVGARGEAGLNGDGGLCGEGHAGAEFGDHGWVAFLGGFAGEGVGHAVEESRCAVGSDLGDVGCALLTGCFAVRLGPGADKGEAGDALGRDAPEFEQHVTTDGTSGEDGFGELKVVHEREDVGGNLLHGEDGSVGDCGEGADGETRAQF